MDTPTQYHHSSPSEIVDYRALEELLEASQPVGEAKQQSCDARVIDYSTLPLLGSQEPLDPLDILLMGRNCKLSDKTRRRLASLLAKRMRRRRRLHYKQINQDRLAKQRQASVPRLPKQKLITEAWRDTVWGKWKRVVLQHRRWHGCDPDMTWEEFRELVQLLVDSMDVSFRQLAFGRLDKSKPLGLGNLVVHIPWKPKDVLYTSISI